jgi:Raf kinase inhibitor-like YbhB/YbcL family protein
MAQTVIHKLNISSPAFDHEGNIPSKYTCEGEGINPPITIEGIPDETKSLAMIVEDPDAPGGTYDHWLVWNIPNMEIIRENSNPGISGTNSSGKTGFHPPCPPKGTHRYYFTLFALDSEIELAPGESKVQLQKAMKQHILAKGALMGKYQRRKQ